MVFVEDRRDPAMQKILETRSRLIRTTPVKQGTYRPGKPRRRSLRHVRRRQNAVMAAQRVKFSGIAMPLAPGISGHAYRHSAVPAESGTHLA
jgi:hypothetical protein